MIFEEKSTSNYTIDKGLNIGGWIFCWPFYAVCITTVYDNFLVEFFFKGQFSCRIFFKDNFLVEFFYFFIKYRVYSFASIS